MDSARDFTCTEGKRIGERKRKKERWREQYGRVGRRERGEEGGLILVGQPSKESPLPHPYRFFTVYKKITLREPL